MPNICLTIAYDGTHYAGWQFQKNAKTIQEKLESVLKKILGEKVKVIASGRTDSGVHAKAQIANFKTKKTFPLNRLEAALNTNLPDDIVVLKAKTVPLKFHSRFDAKSKLYRYTILNSSMDDPFLRRYYWKVPYELNLALLKKEGKALVGRHDFKAFQAKNAASTLKSTVRTIKGISVIKDKKFVHIKIVANGFLHHMVRNIVGTLIEIGRGHFPPGSMKKILHSRQRESAGPTAPARGLVLLSVYYT